ncbi:MAG: PhnD/SsuA/transferrin family substrate-binding protein, partial [Proteobacteria bacterium]|nr:PhnD/SsuA/transferrin family substrate-binding protein [Pseudomonadota bacterium]
KATELVAENTRTGMLKGKISYMSPEQALQDDIDRRSDIFALGIIAWELIAGRKLFSGKSELATMQNIVQGKKQNLLDFRPETPAPLLAVINKALAVDKNLRFETALQMRLAFIDAARESGLRIDQDRTSLLIKTLLGEKHRARQKAVDDALDRTLVTLSIAHPPKMDLTTTTKTRVRTASLFTMFGLFIGVIITAIVIGGVALVFVLGLFDKPAQPPTPVYEGPPIVISIAAASDEQILQQEYQPLARYLESHLEQPVKFDIHNSYAEVSRRLLSGEAQYASLPPNTYVQTKFVEDKVEILAIKQFDGSSGTDGYLIVPEDSKAETLDDLKGSTICHANKLSTTGYVIPRAYIKEQGFDPDNDFTPHISGSHYQVMRDLLAGICEVGSTYSGAFITADEAGINTSQLRVFNITGRTPHDAFCSGPS